MSMFSLENKHVVKINYLTPDEKKTCCLRSVQNIESTLYVIENQRNLLRHLPLRAEKYNADKAKHMQESVV